MNRARGVGTGSGAPVDVAAGQSLGRSTARRRPLAPLLMEKPTAHRRDRHPHHRRRPAMTNPGGLGSQRGPDDLHRVAPAHERVVAHQHMRPGATGAPGPTWSAWFVTARPTNLPPPRRPPRPQPATTPGTTQLARQQRALDYELIGFLRSSTVPPGTIKGPPGDSPENSGRVLARTGRRTLPPPREQGQPEGRPHLVPTPAVATTPARPQPARRSTPKRPSSGTVTAARVNWRAGMSHRASTHRARGQ